MKKEKYKIYEFSNPEIIKLLELKERIEMYYLNIKYRSKKHNEHQ